MSANQLDHFKGELRRLREGIADAFRENPRHQGGKGWVTQPMASSHVVPSSITILDVMEGDLATVHPETRIAPALTLMIENRISSVPVVDGDHRIVGALNEKDLMKVFYDPDAGSVDAVMTRDPVSVSIDAPLVDVVDRLMSFDFRRVLIHERERLVGVITRSHLMPALLGALERNAVSQDAARGPH